MATLQSLINGIKAATTDVTPATLGTDGPMNFLGADAITVPLGGFSAVYAFGDSLTDAGNAFYASRGVVPVSPPYADGHFSNGQVWVQDLAQSLGLPSLKASLIGGTDYAYGGAQTGSTPVHSANPTDLQSQLGQFVLNNPSPPADALYAVWAGGNDVLNIANHVTDPAQQQADVTAAVQNETNFLHGLVAAGAKNIMVLNVPDVGKIPYETSRGPTISATATRVSADYNTQLENSLQSLAATGAVKVDLVDTYSLIDTAIASPATYGFTNVTQPVWTGDVTDPSSGTLNATGSTQDQYMFFDSIHPTAHAHSLIGAAAYQHLTGVS